MFLDFCTDATILSAVQQLRESVQENYNYKELATWYLATKI